jgi:hypothetical protein
MHAPNRLKNNRAAVGAHAVAAARRPPFGASMSFYSAAVSTLSGANSADVLHVCAGLLRAADGASIASNLSSKDRVSDTRSAPSSVPRYDQNGLSALDHERRDVIGDIPVQQENPKWNENTPSKGRAGFRRL